MGGDWPGSPNGSTPFPSQMLVDYVRVYQGNSSASSIASGEIYTLTNKCSGKVLDVTEKSDSDGAKMQQWTNYSTNNQRFRIDDMGGGYYKLISKETGLVMDVDSASTADGAKVQQWTDNGTDAQMWCLTRVQ